jgi:hypothetical protein
MFPIFFGLSLFFAEKNIGLKGFVFLNLVVLGWTVLATFSRATWVSLSVGSVIFFALLAGFQVVSKNAIRVVLILALVGRVNSVFGEVGNRGKLDSLLSINLGAENFQCF